MPSNQGMDWIRLSKRMAIYLRDGFDCIWCRAIFPIEEAGYGLTLDHVYVDGCNEHYNLVTCCHRCNSSRRRTTLEDWLLKISERTGEPERDIAHRVLSALGKPLDMSNGKRLAKARRPAMAVAAE